MHIYQYRQLIHLYRQTKKGNTGNRKEARQTGNRQKASRKHCPNNKQAAAVVFYAVRMTDAARLLDADRSTTGRQRMQKQTEARQRIASNAEQLPGRIARVLWYRYQRRGYYFRFLYICIYSQLVYSNVLLCLY